MVSLLQHCIQNYTESLKESHFTHAIETDSGINTICQSNPWDQEIQVILSFFHWFNTLILKETHALNPQILNLK